MLVVSYVVTAGSNTNCIPIQALDQGCSIAGERGCRARILHPTVKLLDTWYLGYLVPTWYLGYLVPKTIRYLLALRILEWFRFPYVGVGVFQCAKERLTVLDSYCLVYDALRCVLCFRVYNLSSPPPPFRFYENRSKLDTLIVGLRANAIHLRSMLSQVAGL